MRRLLGIRPMQFDVFYNKSELIVIKESVRPKPD